MIDGWPFGFAAICAGILMPLAIRARSIGRDEPGGIQHLQLASTSRLGGIVIVVACAATLAVFFHDNTPTL
jgi:hypothetical protein